MDTHEINTDLLEALTRFSTPTISNAIEVFGVCPRNEGFMGPEIRCLTPLSRPMVGLACTGKFRAAEPPDPGVAVSPAEYWDWLVAQPEPRIMVLQDLDDPPAVGSFWGEVQATIHQALGCIGTVTNGGVRDVPEVAKMGFALFASAPIVSHAYVHLVEYGEPVEVGGLTVTTGDLLHADEHGVIRIPEEIATRLPKVAQAYEDVEQTFIAQVRESGFTVEKLKGVHQAFRAARAGLKMSGDLSRQEAD
jgi:4-hydroxy-4-methyl-2-oxoglutarate aldolase